jgi:hypothetical protein
MSKPPKAGGEIDSWCTKCRLFLNHRIIAMVGPRPARVECSTCGSHHNFRPRPPGEKAEPAARGARSGGSSAPRAPRGMTRAEEARHQRETQWEKAIAGRALSDFTPYRVSHMFVEGQLIRHTKFGEGVVVRVVDPHKVEIMFRDDNRTLAQGLTD